MTREQTLLQRDVLWMSCIGNLRCTAHLGGQRAFCRRQGSPPITWVWRVNSGCQVWQQTPFPTDLSFQPLFLSFETESCCIIHAGCELSLLIFLPSAETAHHAQHSLLVVPPSFLLPSPLLSYLIEKNAHGGRGVGSACEGNGSNHNEKEKHGKWTPELSP